jgi:eukaryotic-like serine/threonine-protein kinase
VDDLPPMEWPDTKLTSKGRDETLADEAPRIGAALAVRLWAYGGPEEPLAALTLSKDSEVSKLIANVIHEGNGEVVTRCSNGIHAGFNQPFQALATAKTLQHRLLTLYRPEPQPQIVAAILVSAAKREMISSSEDASTEVLSPHVVLEANNAAQILVSEEIRELARNKAGFQFSSAPVQDESAAGAVYELFWTDESTYGHLRQAGDTTSIRTAGRYEIQEELGRGNMGVVYKAFDQLIGRVVALKTIAIGHNAPDRRELIERLKREAKAAGGLDHPNIITIFDVGQEDDRLYLSMQFVEGRTLQAILEEGQLPSLSTLISYAEQICSAVDYAHSRGVVHRDLKPANLMLTNKNTIKVLDFGIAKIEDATLTQTGIVVGTPTHMAPEQVAGKKIDQRTDIFALGSVFYELFTREKPFQGDITTVLYKIAHEDPLPPSIINPALPGGIDAIIRKALAKDPKDRYQSCAEMEHAFHQQAALVKTRAHAAPTVAISKAVARSPGAKLADQVEVPDEPRRRRVWPTMVAVFLLAAGCIAGWSFYVKSRSGVFPPVIQRANAIIGRAFHRRTANVSNTSGAASSRVENRATTQQAQNSTGIGAAPQLNPATTGLVPSTAADATAPQQSASEPASPAAKTQAVSASTSLPSDSTQPPANVPPPSTEAHSDGSEAILEKTDGTALRSWLQTDSPVQSKPNSAPAIGTPPAQQSSSATGDEVRPATQAKTPKAAGKNRAVARTIKVDGFSRGDVRDLLRQANAAADRGDYRQARYEYALILKLERNNADARTGLRRAEAAERGETH